MRTSLKDARGVALVELAIVLPVILLIALGAFDLVRVLHYFKVASVITREAANIAFRDCSYSNTDNQRRIACMGQAFNDITKLATHQLPGSCVIMTLHIRNTDATTTTETRTGADCTQRSQFGSTAAVEAMTNSHLLDADFSTRQVIAIGEIYAPYTSFVPGLARFFGPEIYEYAIL